MTESMASEPAEPTTRQPSREIGTCIACGKPMQLRESPGTPYPPLPVWHTGPTPVRHGEIQVTCNGWVQVCREWQDYITSDPTRSAAHAAAFTEWVAARSHSFQVAAVQGELPFFEVTNV